jgi:hypothetical protein
MGMNKRSHVTNGVQILALDLASTMPYRRSADVLRKTTAIDITHQTIWRLVAKTADPYLEKTAQELKWLQETGEMPASEEPVAQRLKPSGFMMTLPQS